MADGDGHRHKSLPCSRAVWPAVALGLDTLIRHARVYAIPQIRHFPLSPLVQGSRALFLNAPEPFCPRRGVFLRGASEGCFPPRTFVQSEGRSRRRREFHPPCRRGVLAVRPHIGQSPHALQQYTSVSNRPNDEMLRQLVGLNDEVTCHLVRPCYACAKQRRYPP